MPLRSKLILFAVVVLLFFLALSAGSYASLARASHDAREARDGLVKLALVEALERSCTDGALPDLLACQRARQALADLSRHPWDEEGTKHLLEVVRQSRNIEEGLPPEDPERLEEAIHRLRTTVLLQVEEDLRLVGEPTRNRAVRLLLASVLAALGGSGTFAWLYSRLVRDRKTLEERVRRSEKLAALGTLAAGVAHEINNPLTTISLSAEALGERLAPRTEEAEFCRAIQEEAERCQNIVRDLSDLARGGALDREPVDPRSLAEEALRIVRRHSPTMIEEDLDSGLPFVSGDRGKLLQVLVNLLQNAVEASADGGRVRLSVHRRDQSLAFEVTDSGKGIPPHLLERIFEPFYSNKERGVGLGLTLCHRIAELHGGEIRATSAGEGHGASFTLMIPVHRRDHAS